MQFYPAASAPEAKVHPGLYQRREGSIDLSSIRGAGFGYRREEMLGRTVELLLPTNLRAIHCSHRRAYMSHPRARPMGAGMALTARRKDGTTFPVEISLSVTSEDGYLVILALITDITERKRIEDQLRESAKLESLGVLAGGIAHDFNNLLTGVLGNASMAMQELPAGSPSRTLIEDIIGSAERAAHLTMQMLSYSGRAHSVVRPVNLSGFTRDISMLLQSSIPRTVQLQLDLLANVPPVDADLAQLQQVIMNLVINAGEAAGDAPGIVAVSTRVREFAAGGVPPHSRVEGSLLWERCPVRERTSGCHSRTARVGRPGLVS